MESMKKDCFLSHELTNLSISAIKTFHLTLGEMDIVIILGLIMV
jgi:hypothetical protein